MTVYTPSGNTGEDVDFSNPKDAKRYAEAHYRERLTQCLIPHTTR